MVDWHGWARNKEVSLHIGHVPQRRSAAMYMTRNGTTKVLAYFASEQDAKEAMAILDHLILKEDLSGKDH